MQQHARNSGDAEQRYFNDAEQRHSNAEQRRSDAKERHSDDAEERLQDLLTWDEVKRTHRIRNGVYQRAGRLVSLLTDFGRINPCYPDSATEDGETVNYTGEGRHGDQHLSPGNRALLAAIESGHAVPLFNKLGVGCWQHTGFWRVTAGEHRFDEAERRMLWRFTLKKVSGSKFKVQGSGRKP